MLTACRRHGFTTCATKSNIAYTQDIRCNFMLKQRDRHCIFCKTPLTQENRSKEHVIPRWLLYSLNVRKENIQPTHFSNKGEMLTKRQHTLEGLLAGQICKVCNCGWMSELEEVAIPIIKPLILGASVVVELNDAERQLLSRWTAKTAFVLNSSSNYLMNIPSTHFEHIRLHTNSLPFKVSTYGQQNHGDRPFYWIQSATWILNGKSNNISKIAAELKNSSYKIGFQFGKLMLLIGYLPLENIYPVIWKGIHVPLLPKNGKCGYYEKKEFSWLDSEKAFFEFHFGLQATILE